jgi:chromosome partitioning protein
MKIITVSSLKGGVGKTTAAVFTTRALATSGARVLCVDLDHNNNSTDYWLRFAMPEVIEDRNVMHFLTRAKELTGVIWGGPASAPSVDIIPATPSLSRIGIELSRDQGAAMRLRAGLRKLDYDYVIIDTPPSLSLELTLGLYAADMVLVPISASRWTVQGYQIIEQEVAAVAESIGLAPRILAVPSMVTEAEAVALQGADIWTATKAAVYRDAPIKAAASEGRALREGTKAAGWFADLAREVAE